MITGYQKAKFVSITQEQKDKVLRLSIFAALIVVFGIVYGLSGDQEEVPVSDLPAVSSESGGTVDKPLKPILKPVVPSFDVVRIGQQGTGVIAGRGTPTAKMEVMIGERVLGSATADMAGEWVLILERPLEPGSVELTIRSSLPDGSTLVSDDVVVVNVPERVAESFVESEKEGVVAVLTPRDGKGASRVLQRPGATPVGEIGDSLTLDTMDYSDDGIATVSGRALPRAQVVLYLDNGFWGQVKATDEGKWTIQPQKAVGAGKHLLRIDQVLDGGDVQLRIEQPFELGRPVDFDMQSGQVVVQPGNSLWHIARRVYGSGLRFTMIFQNNSDQIRDPNLIYPGQLFELPKKK